MAELVFRGRAGEPEIDPFWSLTGRLDGDPAKLANALLTVVDQEHPPFRWIAGADAVATVEQKANELPAQVDA